MTYAQPQSMLYAPVAPSPVPLEEMPDPATIENQKTGFLKGIDVQTNAGTSALSTDIQQRKAAIRGAADAQKAQFNAQVEAELQQQLNLLDQQYQREIMGLQQRASAQKAALEQQAIQHTMRYQQTANMVQLQRQKAVWDAAQADLLAKQQSEIARLQQEQQALAAQYQQISQPSVVMVPLPPPLS